MAMSSPSNADKYEVFESWLRGNGAQFDLLELREYDVDNSCNLDDNHSNSTYGETAEEKKEPPTQTSSASGSSSSIWPVEDEIEMRGVHSKCDIPPNTICVSVPRLCLITVEMGQATSIGQAILNSDLELDAPKHVFLMVFLLWDRKVNGESSFFKPYYDILPPTLRNMPIFWSEDELSYLKGSYLLDQIADRNDAIEDDFHAICHVAPELGKIATLDEFKWARMCVCSRNFGLQIDGNRTSALVPHADMLNHYRPRETKWTFDDDRQAFIITSLQRIPAGAEVFDSYGQKCNHRFLLNYGFAVENNSEADGFCPNEVNYSISILPDDPLFEAKFDFWTRGENISCVVGNAVMHLGGISPRLETQSHSNTFSGITSLSNSGKVGSLNPNTISSAKRIRVCVSNNENTRILFSMLRVVVADELELRMLMTGPTTMMTSTSTNISRAVLGLSGANLPSSSSFYRTCRDIRCPLSLRNERAAMKHLLEVTASALRLYPTSFSQDISDLMDERRFPRYSNKRHAKIQVRGEKEVLHHFAELATTAIAVMDIIEQECLNELRVGGCTGEAKNSNVVDFDTLILSMENSEEKHHTIVRYCADVLGSLRREEKKRITRTSNSVMQCYELHEGIPKAYLP